MALIIGSYISDVKCENFYDRLTSQIRVRPLPDQGLPTTLLIECCKYERSRHPLGTVFITENVKVCQKPTGVIYLRAKDQKIYKVEP